MGFFSKNKHNLLLFKKINKGYPFFKFHLKSNYFFYLKTNIQ